MADMVRRSYDGIADAYAQRFADELRYKSLDRALLADLAAQLGGGARVADVGCGPGHVTAHLAGLGLDALGVDLSPGMLEIARRRHPDLTFERASMLELPVGDAGWDGIVALYSVIHLDDGQVPLAFAEFRRALRPGGLVLLSFHVGDEVRHVSEMLEQAAELDFHFRPLDTMREWLAAAGFTVEVALERAPYAEIEGPTRRGYLVGRSLPS